MVADVAFVQKSSGAAAAAGTLLGHGATSANIVGPGGRSNGMASSEESKQRNINILHQYQVPCKVPDSVLPIAERHLKLAHEYGFTKGRPISHVIAVCLFLGCKLKNTSHMLIDFADVLRVNVYDLGITYTRWVKRLGWNPEDGWNSERFEEHQPLRQLVDPSIWIARFVDMLEFGEDSHKVRDDAVRIAARFKENWINEGRRTAGICGAAIYLAAQMNHYRRTIQEIVQVVKIADTTLVRRLEEFSATPSASLTVGDFRTTAHATEAADPPAFTRNRELERELAEGPSAGKPARRGKKRRRAEMEQQTEPELSPPVESETQPTPQLEQEQPAYMLTGEGGTNTGPVTPLFLITPVTPRTVPAPAPSASPLRNFRAASEVNSRIDPAAIRPANESEEIDTEMTEKEDTTLEKYDETLEKDDETREEEREKAAQKASGTVPDVDHQQVEEIEALLQSNTGQLVLADAQAASNAQVEAEAAAAPPIEDDLTGLDEVELDNYLCTDAEALLRERVWTEFNLDYLRKLAAKRFKDQTGEEIAPKKKRKIKAKPTFVPGKTAFESVQTMMQTSKKFSKRINYNVLKAALPDDLNEKEDDEDDEYKEDEPMAEGDTPEINKYRQVMYGGEEDEAIEEY